MVLRTVDAPVHVVRRAALLAGFEIREPFEQLALQPLMPRDRFARLLELALEQRAQLGHRLRADAGPPPRRDHLAHLVQREAQRVEEVDPAQPVDGARLVEAEAAARAGGRLEQAQLLIEMNRASRLAGLTRQVSDAEQMSRMSAHTPSLDRALRKPDSYVN